MEDIKDELEALNTNAEEITDSLNLIGDQLEKLVKIMDYISREI
ncbi:MAG: hypothetical protein Q4D42_10695 [Eubacteriales bacterium]|nr:hypothetical protein [Eubacteriales bacterium]